jgi:hypothetical protein
MDPEESLQHEPPIMPHKHFRKSNERIEGPLVSTGPLVRQRTLVRKGKLVKQGSSVKQGDLVSLEDYQIHLDLVRHQEREHNHVQVMQQVIHCMKDQCDPLVVMI